MAFADIHDFIIQQDRIHASAFKLRGQSLSLQGLVYALLKRQRVHLPYLSYRDSRGLDILPRNHNTAVQRGYMPLPSVLHNFEPLCISKPNPLFHLCTLSYLPASFFSCSFSLKNKFVRCGDNLLSLHSIYYTIFIIYIIYFYIIRRIFWFVCWIILSVSRFCLRVGLWDFIEIILIAAGLNEIPAIY